MKECEEFAPLLSACVDGELTEEERAEVLAHVSECEKCRRLLGELTALHAALGELEDEDVPAGFTEGVMAAMRAEKAAKKPQTKKRSAWRRWNFSGIISSHSLKTADIDCIVYDVTTAACLTRMFADKTTGGREWIVLTDQADRICVTSFSDKSDISRNIYMCRAQRYTRNRLCVLAGTSSLAHMFFIVFPTSHQTLVNHVSCFIPDRTVSSFHD